MRILHILNDVCDAGNGIINTAVDIAIEQARQGHSVAVASAGGSYQTFLESGGVRHVMLAEQPRRPLQIVESMLVLRRRIVEFKPDVVHAHVRTGLILAWIWSRFFRFTLIAHAHNVHDKAPIILGLAHRVLAVSRSVAETIERQGVPKKKIRVVLNRILGSPRQPASSVLRGKLLSRPSIVTVGGMCHRKGIAELILAFEIVGVDYPHAHLYLVGEGPERELFEKQARGSRFAARIHFEGFQSVPQTYMLSADIFVLASRRDSFPVVLIEARQAACAIVASDVDGIAEALDGGRAGVLVPPQNPEALAAALSRLLANEHERVSLQREALVGLEEFKVSSLAAEIHSIYLESVHKSSSRVSESALSESQ